MEVGGAEATMSAGWQTSRLSAPNRNGKRKVGDGIGLLRKCLKRVKFVAEFKLQ